jgi:uncharacterized hydantoinase/oxoprolinase family protein
MIAADAEEFNHRDAVAIAQAAADAQASRLAAAIGQVKGAMSRPPERVVLSGHGEFLARDAMDVLQFKPQIVSLIQELGPAIARSGPAHALATIAREVTGP